jgi:hypothetical protein
MHVVKPMDDIKADLVMDINEGRDQQGIANALLALRASYGLSQLECMLTVHVWIMAAAEQGALTYAS